MEGENQSPPEIHCVCKLKHDIRVESKIELARREIEVSLGVHIKTLATLPALFKKYPFSQLDDMVIDRMTRLLYLGSTHGFLGELQDPRRLVRLAKNSTYLREIYGVVATQKDEIPEILKALGSIDTLERSLFDKNKFIDISPSTQIYSQRIDGDSFLITMFLIPMQTLLEYSSEVVKLPYVTFTKQFTDFSERLDRMESGVKKGIDDLLKHLTHGFKRMPWIGLFKEKIGDYVDWAFSDFRTWGLHFIHKHEGKADPWLARSTLNLLDVEEGSTVLDPFCGSGTFIADAPILNINAIGVDVNPLSTLIARAKCSFADIPLQELKESLARLNRKSSDELLSKDSLKPLLTDLDNHNDEKSSENESTFLEILTLKNAIDAVSGEDLTRDFLYTVLSRTIIEVCEKQKKHFRAKDNFIRDALTFYLYAYASQHLLDRLNIDVKGKCSILTADAHDLKSLIDRKVDGIVTSPPYFDALDYIGFSKLSLRILDLDEANEHLAALTIGSKYRTARETEQESLVDLLPDSSKSLIREFLKAKRKRKAGILLQYVTDMRDCLQTFSEMLNQKRKIIFVVGKYHNWKLGNKNVQLDGARVLMDLGEQVGLHLEDELSHNISKIEAGKRIKQESVIIWIKE